MCKYAVIDLELCKASCEKRTQISEFNRGGV